MSGLGPEAGLCSALVGVTWTCTGSCGRTAGIAHFLHGSMFTTVLMDQGGSLTTACKLWSFGTGRTMATSTVAREGKLEVRGGSVKDQLLLVSIPLRVTSSALRIPVLLCVPLLQAVLLPLSRRSREEKPDRESRLCLAVSFSFAIIADPDILSHLKAGAGPERLSFPVDSIPPHRGGRVQ